MMFVGKDQENLLRARNIKRIAFVLYTGELDQWSNYLTTIQENLVDALKLSNALAVYEQVFLCLRVMLLRLSHKKLTSFWPVILAEMVFFSSHLLLFIVIYNYFIFKLLLKSK